MMHDPALIDEHARMAALHRLDVLDTEAEAGFDHVVSLVRTVLGVPIATVTLVAEERQWFKAQQGMPCQQTPRDVSFCTHTIRQRAPFVIPDALADPRFASSPLVAGAPHIRSYAGIPLSTADGYNVGALCAIDTKPRDFAAAELAILQNFAAIVVNELELRLVARRDQLTGALSRRGFMERAEQEMERHRRYGRAGSLLVVDVDHFKRVNDTYGHPAGDVVLRGVATTLAATIRPNDALGRLGGEEFGILLPETDGPEALRAADRLRRALVDARFDCGAAGSLGVTASFGVAPVDAGVASVEAWIARADAPLYEAKRDGRNRCVLARPATAEREVA